MMDDSPHLAASAGPDVRDGGRPAWRRAALLLAVLWLPSCLPAAAAPQAVDGVIDLSRWDFERDGMVRLDGVWELYWQRLLQPPDFAGPVPPGAALKAWVPGPWRGLAESGSPRGGSGWGTYRLRVELSPQAPALALRIQDQAQAYRLWGNDRPLAGSGTVSANPATARPRSRTELVRLSQPGSTLELLMQVSSFRSASGGAVRPLLLGTVSQVWTYHHRLVALDLFLLGALVVLGLYHVWFYVVRRRDRSPIYLGAFCLAWALRIPFVGASGGLISSLFPTFPWELIYRLDLLGFYLAVPLTLMFLLAAYGSSARNQSHARGILRASQVLGAAFAATALIAPPPVAELTLLPYEGIAFLTALYCVDVLVRAIRQRQQGALTTLLGVAFFVALALNDTLLDNLLIESIFLIHLRAFGMTLSHAIALTHRFSTAELRAELEQRARGEELARLKAEQATLAMLRYQLDPHFLANTLTSLGCAIRCAPETARHMVSLLSRYCERNLRDGAGLWHSVGQELEQIRLYLAIEQARQGEYLQVHEVCDPAAEACVVPSLLLQPLVENALKHGKRSSPEELQVRIEVRILPQATLQITVANTGRWIPPRETSDAAELRGGTRGIGLQNLRQRLDALYPGRHTIERSAAHGWVQIELTLPAATEAPVQAPLGAATPSGAPGRPQADDERNTEPTAC